MKAADYYYIGLFGCAINAEISDLNIQDATITANNCTLNVNVGTVAGRADSTTITRCTVDCTVSYCRASTKDFYIGGIVGRSYTGVVTDCVVQGSVRGVSTYENRIYLGGVIGYASEVSVSRCISGTVCYAESRETPIAGGVIGYMQEGSKIRACVSFGSGEAYCSGSYYSYADKICAYIKDTSSTATGCKNEITYTKAFFTSLGFEESVWNLDGVEGGNLPSPIQN